MEHQNAGSAYVTGCTSKQPGLGVDISEVSLRKKKLVQRKILKISKIPIRSTPLSCPSPSSLMYPGGGVSVKKK